MSAYAEKLYRRRRLVNAVAMVLSVAAAIFGLFFLLWILWTTLTKGLGAMNADLFTMMTPPPNERGGLLNAFFGSAVICALAILLGAPIGVAAGTYLAEYANYRKLGAAIRFVNDILLSAPSIVLGLFVYTIVVLQMGHFSALAGAIALAFIALPVIVRTTDEMLRLVPTQMREAALSLGVPQWKVIVQVLYRGSMSGIVTGVLLALARISGETAPLLFTAYSNQFWSTDLMAPMANVPMVIFQYAMSPFHSWNQLAWAGAFVVTVFVLLLSLCARLILLRNRVPND
ncbi:phosphate ABC transporter permease PstA [Coralloluteibacterium thermophilus]|uniref:Phosphate transport system permease protein PstA n=1 Tax=Coralloluteibacterium thermophilum TaxID=2707049 RepID=A0ABV9NKC2_9GAMM